jgi:hypothetical protein
MPQNVILAYLKVILVIIGNIKPTSFCVKSKNVYKKAENSGPKTLNFYIFTVGTCKQWKDIFMRDLSMNGCSSVKISSCCLGVPIL